jgi:hypothetical protein
MVRRQRNLSYSEELALLAFFAQAMDISWAIPAEKLVRIDGASEAINGAYRIGEALGWRAPVLSTSRQRRGTGEVSRRSA